MSNELEGDFLEALSRIVREAKELQQAGRLQDPVSRAEVTMLEHQLRVMEARITADAVSTDATNSTERATAVSAWARALAAASRVTRNHSRRLRKDLYRVRLISGSNDD